MMPVDLNNKNHELDIEAKEQALEEPEPEPQPIPQEPEPTEPETEEEEPEEVEESEGITEQAAISAYLPAMHDSIKRLMRKESLSHESAAKKDPVQMKEHLDKFYIKFEQELADCFTIHANYLCNVKDKEKFTGDKLLFIAKDVCQWEKSENQADKVIEHLLQEIVQLDDAPFLGEIRSEGGKNYIFTMHGWDEVNVQAT
jgi:hypothetical protein